MSMSWRTEIEEWLWRQARRSQDARDHEPAPQHRAREKPEPRIEEPVLDDPMPDYENESPESRE